jgi:hypothetical protein
LLFIIDEDVSWLEVPVDDPMLDEFLEAGEHVDCNFHGSVKRHFLLLL